MVIITTSVDYFFQHGSPFFITIIISIIILQSLFKLYTKPRPSFRPPPGPPSFPIIGHLHLLTSSSSLTKSFQSLATRYGPLMTIHIGPSPFIIISNASVAKDIFKTHDINFTSRFEIGPSQYSIYKGCGFLSGPSGDYWRFMKKLCVTKLFAGPQLERFNSIRKHEIEKLLRSLKTTSQAQPSDVCNLTTELSDLTNNVMFRMTMSKRFLKNPQDGRRVRKTIREMMECAAKFGVNEVHGFLKSVDLFGKGKRLRESMWRYDMVMEEIMKDYEENLVGVGEKDLMDILLETYADVNAEVKISRDHIKYFLLELFLSSIDTVSTAIQWAMADLINHPQEMKKLREEINRTIELKRLVRESDVSNLPFLQAVVKETLRLHSPSHIIHRECTKDCKINGYNIKAKDRIMINSHAIMRDPNCWTDPDKYFPERFLVGEMESRGQDFRYIPFGGGRRGCVGVTHAYLVMHGAVGALVQCFDWKLREGDDKVEVNVGTGCVGANPDFLEFYPVLRFDPF